jgi:hypothetical protein
MKVVYLHIMVHFQRVHRKKIMRKVGGGGCPPLPNAL